MSVKPVRIARAAPLLVSESSPGVVSGDDVDWDTSSSASNAIPNNLQWKQPVTCATTGAITISTGLNSGDTIDGVTLAAGDRVLVKDQALPKENGIYIVDAAPFRSVDMDDPSEFPGALVWVTAGTANTGTMWYCTNTAEPVVDTDAVNFAQFTPVAPAGTYRLDIEGGQETINALGSVTGAVAVDPTAGNIVTLTMTGDVTATISAPVGSAGSDLEWWVTQDGSGGHTLTIAATGGTVTDDGTITPATTAGITVRYITERIPGTSNDWLRDLVGGSPITFAAPSGGYGTPAAGSAATALRSDAVFPKPTESDISLSAVTTNDVSTTKHGFAPTLPNDATKFLDGTGAYSVPAGSGTGTTDHEHVMDVLMSGDASTTAFELPAAPFDAYSVAAYVAGTLTEVTLSGAMLTTATFGSAPGSGTDNIRFDIVAAVV